MVGKTISHYQVLEKIGEGGMGVVWKARDTQLDRDVAMKVLPADAVTDPAARARLVREARLASKLNHPHICTVHEVGESDGQVFVAMELVEGQPLSARLAAGALPVEQVLRFGLQLTDALAHAHKRGVIHRDLKSANVVITPEGRAKVLDFGLAKRLKGETEEDVTTQTLETLTTAGTVAGTPAYMAPEQFRGQPADARSDIWALGVMLYEMASGMRPFRGTTAFELSSAILNQPPTPLPPGPGGPAPLWLRSVIERCLEKDPARRYQSSDEVRASLETVQAGVTLRVWLAWKYGLSRRRWLAVGAAVVAVVVLVAAGVFVWQRMQAKPLTDKDVLVLADFTNVTGDPVFDVTLREALAVELEQSPFLKILGDERMREDLRLMGRPAGQQISSQVAREICQREGEKAMIGGSIASLGKTYAITLRAANCQTGEALARQQVQAEDKEHVLQAVAAAAKGMRAKLGESLASIQKLDVPDEQATTPSIEAFQAYALGKKQYLSGLSSEARSFYRRATELDPNFALAHQALGDMYRNIGWRVRATEHMEKAFALVDRVSEHERLRIIAWYYSVGTGELHKAADAYQLFVRTYPRESRAHNELGVLIHLGMGEWEKALEEFQEAMRLDPRLAFSYSNVVSAYVHLDRLDEAKAVAQKAVEQKFDFPSLHRRLLRIAYLQGDRPEADKQIQWLAGKPEELYSLDAQIENAVAIGRFREGRERFRRITDVAQRLNPSGKAVFAIVANAEGQMGNCNEALDKGRAAVGEVLAPNFALLAARSLAECGDFASAQKVAEEASKRYPLDTLWNAVHLPSIRAAVELRRNQPEKALELLRSATPYERAHAYAVYLRGIAYLRLRKGAEAAAQFQQILDHKGTNWGPYYSLSYVGLARAAALSGDTARARKAYQDFLALWKDADPDIPILKEAKQEYARLK